jgi:phosphoglycolate phosphatase
MPYRLVIFDYDGTLADSGQWFADNLNRFAVKHKFRQVTPEEIGELRTMPTREVVRRLKVRPWRMPFIAADMRRAVSDPSATPKLFPGVAEMMARVDEAGVGIAVVSSNTEANIRVGLGPVNAARVDIFDCGAGVFGKMKKLKRVARRFGAAPPEVICVGDDTRDIDAAHQAGFAAAAVGWGYASEVALRGAGPEVFVRDMDELAQAIGV